VRSLRVLALCAALATLGCGTNGGSDAGIDALLPGSDAQDTETSDLDDAARTDDGTGRSCRVSVLGSIAHGPEATRAFELRSLDTRTAHPLAVCNDGSPAIFVIRPGSGAGRERWLIYLDGGGECHDLDSCNQRSSGANAAIQMSSLGYTPTWLSAQRWNGVHSTNAAANPLFHDATLVFVPYCSSDVWSGDRGGEGPTAPGTRRWHFRGREILRGVIQELLSVGLSAATEIVLAGTSAGGYGVLNNADDVGAMLPAGARYVAIADAGFFIDHPAYDGATHAPSTATPTLLQQLLTVGAQTWGGRGDESCERALGASGPGRCRFGEVMMVGGHVATPVFLQESQLDNNQLTRLGTGRVDDLGRAAVPEEQPYVDGFAAHMRALLGSVDPWHAVYSGLDSKHGGLNGADYDRRQIGAVRLAAFMQTWYLDPCRGPRLIELPGSR